MPDNFSTPVTAGTTFAGKKIGNVIYEQAIFVDETGADAFSQLLAALAGTLTVADANSAAFQGVEALTVNAAQSTPRRSIGCSCTAEGNATFLLADGSSITLPMYVGWQTFPFAVKQVAAFTGTGTFFNLK